MKKLFIPIVIFIGIGMHVNAQEKSRKEKKADKYAFNYSYDKAIETYSHAKHLSVEGQRKLAESYHNINQNIQSDSVYSQFINNSSGGILPEDYFNYAMVLKTNGKIEESNKWMDKFKDVKPEDLRAKDYAAHKDEFGNFSKDDGKYRVKHLDVNTDAEDFGTCYYKNKIVFSSSGANPKVTEKTYNWNRKPFLDIYVSEVENGQLKTAEIFDKSLNRKMHDGPASFSKDGNIMAFTQNNYDLKRKELVVRIQICFTTFKDEKWSTPEPFVLNSKEYSVGHPCLTSDGNTMYFTSDMPGGFGGTDIYRISKDAAGAWGKAENLGNKINTEGDELFPFFEEKNGVLFFASNGRFGLGGLDIFIAVMQGYQVGTVRNAGYPLNTAYDDFSVIVNDKLKTGYFSSNRTGGSGDDDIYSVDLLKGIDIGKRIEGFAKNSEGSAIPKTFITLFDGSEKVIDTLTTKDDGSYSFFVDSDKTFKLTGNKETYIEGTTVTNTIGKDYVVKANLLLLKKEPILVQKTIEQKIIVGADLAKILEFNPAVIYFDYGKSVIRPDAKIDLDKIVKIMNQYPDMVVELGSHTDCRSTKQFNQVLSNKRAAASAGYVKERITKPARIYGKGYGETKLATGCACEGTVVSNCSEEEFQKDRRTEFIIIKKVSTGKLPLTSK